MKWFKQNTTGRLEKKYQAKLTEARDAQRGGDIQKFAALTQEAEAILKEIQVAEQSQQ